MPPRSRRWANGLLRNEAVCVGWQVAQSFEGVFASSVGAFASGECTEWQERQSTVPVEA